MGDRGGGGVEVTGSRCRWWGQSQDGHTCPVWLKSEPLGLVLDVLDISTCGSFEFSAPGLVSQVFGSL